MFYYKGVHLKVYILHGWKQVLHALKKWEKHNLDYFNVLESLF